MSAAATDVVLTKSDSSGTSTVTIALTKFSMQYTKSLVKITPPVTAPNASVTTPKKDTKVVDINREAEVRFDVDGTIKTDYKSDSIDVMTKLEAIEDIFFARGAVTLSMFGWTKSIFIDKFAFDWVPDDQPNVEILTVKFTAVEGVDIFG